MVQYYTHTRLCPILDPVALKNPNIALFSLKETKYLIVILQLRALPQAALKDIPYLMTYGTVLYRVGVNYTSI